MELIIQRFSLDRVILAIDDTTCLHKGKRVYGRAKHRDGVRSSHSMNIPLWGHKWVVVSMVVRLSQSSRQWALPVAVGLCRSSEYAKENARKHKTPAHIARLLIAKIRRHFPNLSMTVVGDQGYGQHETTRWLRKFNVTHVSKFYPDAVLHEEIKKDIPWWRPRLGRPPRMGSKMLRPQQVVLEKKPYESEVTWYGGKKRCVEIVTGVGNWYRVSQPLVKVRWVFVRDLSGTHRDEYFYSNDPDLTPEEIVSLYTSRWSIETTFQECKGTLKIDKTRVWSEKSTLTLIPILFGLYSAVVLIGASLHVPIHERWPGKSTITFTDLIQAIRKEIWSIQPFLQRLTPTRLSKNQNHTERILIQLLSHAA